jgi:cell cycle checkpoint control protein RAD9A
MLPNNGQAFSQHHPSNWVDAEDNDDEDDDDGQYIQATPPYYDEQ